MQGSANKEEARWYVGKRCAYVYKAKNKTSVPGQAEKSNLRCIWGKVSSTNCLVNKQSTNITPLGSLLTLVHPGDPPSWQRWLCARQVRAQPSSPGKHSPSVVFDDPYYSS